MGGVVRSAHIAAMIVATLVLADPVDPGQEVTLEFRLNAGYGATAALAHEVVLLCLTAVEWPLVFDDMGAPLYIPPGSLKGLTTRSG